MKERWKRAAAHLERLDGEYLDIGWHGRYTRQEINRYRGRLYRGERTDKLYKQIMELR